MSSHTIGNPGVSGDIYKKLYASLQISYSGELQKQIFDIYLFTSICLLVFLLVFVY